MKLDPAIHIVMHSVLSLKSGVTQVLEARIARGRCGGPGGLGVKLGASCAVFGTPSSTIPHS